MKTNQILRAGATGLLLIVMGAYVEASEGGSDDKEFSAVNSIRVGQPKSDLHEHLKLATFSFPRNNPHSYFFPGAKIDHVLRSAMNEPRPPVQLELGVTVRFDKEDRVFSVRKEKVMLPDLRTADNFGMVRVGPFFPVEAEQREVRFVFVDSQPSPEGEWAPILFRPANLKDFEESASRFWLTNHELINKSHISGARVDAFETLRVQLDIRQDAVEAVSKAVNASRGKQVGFILDSQLICVMKIPQQQQLWSSVLLGGSYTVEDAQEIANRANLALKLNGVPGEK